MTQSLTLDTPLLRKGTIKILTNCVKQQKLPQIWLAEAYNNDQINMSSLWNCAYIIDISSSQISLSCEQSNSVKPDDRLVSSWLQLIYSLKW
jgi:hypothetical protein